LRAILPEGERGNRKTNSEGIAGGRGEEKKKEACREIQTDKIASFVETGKPLLWRDHHR